MLKYNAMLKNQGRYRLFTKGVQHDLCGMCPGDVAVCANGISVVDVLLLYVHSNTTVMILS